MLAEKRLQLEGGIISIIFETFFDDVHSNYSGIDTETMTLSTTVEQPDDGDDDDRNNQIRKRKRFADETTDNEVHLKVEGRVKI